MYPIKFSCNEDCLFIFGERTKQKRVLLRRGLYMPNSEWVRPRCSETPSIRNTRVVGFIFFPEKETKSAVLLCRGLHMSNPLRIWPWGLGDYLLDSNWGNAIIPFPEKQVKAFVVFLAETCFYPKLGFAELGGLGPRPLPPRKHVIEKKNHNSLK